MTKKIKNSYWLYLLVLLLAIQVVFFAVVFSVRDVQARYPQTTRVNTVVQGPAEVVKSDCLTLNGNQIVLLGNKTKAEFTLVCEKDTEIRINWTVASDNASVRCRTTERELPNGTEIQLKANEVTTVTMAISKNTDKTVDVIVTCGELSCIFRADFTVEDEFLEQQPNESIVPDEGSTENGGSGENSENTPPENESSGSDIPENNPSENDPSEEIETPLTEDTESDAPEEGTLGGNESEIETTTYLEGEEDAAQEGNNTETGDTTPTDSPENLINPEESTENPDNESDVPEDTTIEDTSNKEQKEDYQNPTVFIKTIAEIDRTGYIPVVLRSNESDEITVSMNGKHFPEFTRYSTDGGNTWYLMYGAGNISLKVSKESIVLLDIPYEAVSETTEITITAKQNGTRNSATVKFTDIILPESTLIISKEFTHIKTGKEPDKILYVSGIAAEAPLCWDDPKCTVEMLTEDDDGKKTYIPLIIDEESTLQIKIENVEMKDGSVKQIVALVMGEDYAPAGTYRLKCNWEYEGVCYMQAEIPFFINYSTCSDA